MAALAEAGYYNNTIFHRIIKGFMIQGAAMILQSILIRIIPSGSRTSPRTSFVFPSKAVTRLVQDGEEKVSTGENSKTK